MTPRMRTLIAYLSQRPHEYTFDDVEMQHLAQGYCVSTPEYYICARPVTKGHPEMANPFAEFALEDCDCWFVWMAGGDLRLLWTILPHDLPWTAFYRHNTQRIRYYETEELHRRASMMGGGGGEPQKAAPIAPAAVPSTADTATAKRSSQVTAAKRKKSQQTMFAGAPKEGSTNMLG